MLVAGDRQYGLNVLVDRKSRLRPISILKAKTTGATKQVMLRRLKGYPSSLTQTITYDNGIENTCHEEINAVFGTRSFFCTPYHSWEKGSVEQVNGLFRRFWPKGTIFQVLGHPAIHRVEKLLNHRPRKCLHYRTPHEVFREAHGALPGLMWRLPLTQASYGSFLELLTTAMRKSPWHLLYTNFHETISLAWRACGFLRMD